MPNRPIAQLIAKQTPVTAPATLTVTEAAALMKQKRIGALLIVVGNQLTGIFTERDALFRVLAEGRNPEKTLVADVMTLEPQTISPDKPLGHALHIMYDAGFRHMPVVRNGVPLGMVSVRDALGAEVLQFEEELRQREEISEVLG